MRSKTMAVVTVVAVMHGAIIGSVFLMQGCGRTAGPAKAGTDEALMPPVEPETTPSAVVPEDRPVTKTSEDTVKPSFDGLKTYVVVKGDILSSIAQRYGVSAKELAELNGLSNPNRISVGHTLYLPAHAQKRNITPKRTVSTPTVSSQPSGTVSGGNYTVAKGDCLSKIASKFGTTTAKIREANSLSSDRINVGQKLVVPGADAAAPVATDVAPPTPTVVAEPPPPVADPMPPVVTDVSAPSPVPGPDVQSAPPSAVTHSLHEVQFGETMDDVARKYAVPADRLISYNSLPDGTIRPGMILKIPQGE